MNSHLFLTRPLAISCGSLLLTLFLVLYRRPDSPLPLLIASLILLSLTAAGFLLLFLDKKRAFLPFLFRKLSLTLLLTLLFTALALMSGFFVNRERAHAAEYHDTEQEAVFLLLEVERYDRITSARAVTESFGGEQAAITTRLLLFGGGEFAPGDRIAGRFAFTLPEEGSTLSDLRLFADGYDLSAAAAGEITRLAPDRSSFSVRLARLRLSLRQLLSSKLDPASDGLFRALLLADKSGLDAATKNGLSALGVSHLLAVSGLHLSIIVGMLGLLFKKLRLPRPVIYPILAFLIFFYMAITGFTLSLLRSGGMLLLFYLSFFLKRRREPVTALFASTAIIVLISPRAILDIGLLFSFSATLGILLIARPINASLAQLSLFRRKPLFPLKKLLSVVTVTLAATAGILPVLYLAEGSLFPFAFLSNLVFTPILTLLLSALPFFFLLLPFPPLFALWQAGVSALSRLLIALALRGRGAEKFCFSLDYPFMPFLILFCGLLLLFLLFKERKRLLLLPVLLFFLLAPTGIAFSDFGLQNSESLYYTGNGKSDALILSFEDKGLVIDFSSSASFQRESLGKVGRRSASVKADTLMMTTCTATHIAGFSKLTDRYSLKNLILPEGNDSADQLAALAEEAGIVVFRYTPGDRILWNGISLVTYPAEPGGATVALKISLSHTEILYLKKNSPDRFDIRFGPMTEVFDTVILGGNGSPPKSAPFAFRAEVVVQNGDINYVKGSSSALLFGEYFVTDCREEASP